jgi:hypothetical protein
VFTILLLALPAVEKFGSGRHRVVAHFGASCRSFFGETARSSSKAVPLPAMRSHSSCYWAVHVFARRSESQVAAPSLCPPATQISPSSRFITAISPVHLLANVSRPDNAADSNRRCSRNKLRFALIETRFRSHCASTWSCRILLALCTQNRGRNMTAQPS